MAHTPLPWIERPQAIKGTHVGHVVSDRNGVPLAFLYHEVDNEPPPDEVDANAALIVKAVNCHHELLAVCKAVLEHLPDANCEGSWDHESAKLLRAAIAKAGGDDAVP